MIASPETHRPRAAAFVLAVLVALGAALTTAPSALAKVTPEQQALVDQVMGRLLARVQRPEGYDAWPPTWKIIDTATGIGAFSSIDLAERPKTVPIIRIDRGFLEQIAQMNEDRAAFVLGHELAHLMLGHSLRSRGDTGVVHTVFEREDEIAADKLGMDLALQAGYSYRPALGAIRRFIDLKQEYTSFEGVGVDHPSWHDRIALLETDDVQAELWKSMSAFRNGVFFLESEQYEHAAECFERVTREFPKCYEGWANLGFAQLMLYCDSLEPEDLRNFNVGQLIVGGFYRRPESLAAGLRGIQEGLWRNAVDSLQKALALKDDLVLAKANLAVAYLVHPSGAADVGQAAQLFSEVSKLLEDEKVAATLDPLARAALLANAWVGVAHNDPAQSAEVMAQIESFLKRAEQEDELLSGVEPLRAAMGYTRATSLAEAPGEAERRNALPAFEQYLGAMSPSSAWWPLAFERYVATAKALGVPAKAKEEFAKRGAGKWRTVSNLTTAGGVTLGISDPADAALAALGAADSTTPITDGSALNLLAFAKQGVSVLMGREVVAIVLNMPNSPRVTLRRPGLGAQPAEIYVGMPRKELESLLGDEWVSKAAAVVDPEERLRMYQSVGLAVKFVDGKVAEIVITQPPRASADK